MIDLHSHILFGLDDGASSLEESIDMARMAAADGITGMVATPHLFSGVGMFRVEERLDIVFQQVKTAVEANGISVTLYRGAENFFVTELKQHLKTHRDFLTINGSDYFLLEFPPDFIFPGTRQFLFDVMSDGLIPIICHPERNQEFQRHPKLLYEFLQMGALSQLDAGSFRGDFGFDVKAVARRFLAHNLVHVIGSDCHNTVSRKPELSYIYNELRGVDEDLIHLLVKEVPEAIVSDRGIPDTGAMRDPDKKISFFDLIRGKAK